MFEFLSFLDCSEFSNTIEIILKLVGLPTALVGVISLVISGIHNRKDRKIDGFKSRLLKVDKMRSLSTIENKVFYEEKYKDKITDSFGLIIDKKWELYKDSNINNISELIELKEVKVNDISKGYVTNAKIPSLKVYPNHNIFTKNKSEQTYVYNFLKHNEKSVYLFNGDLYAAKDIKIEINEENKLVPVFDVYKTNYYNFLNTCKSLELLYESKEKNKKLEIDILDLTNRHAGIGINCLTIIKNVRKRTDSSQKRNYLLLHVRNDKIMESPNKIHVVPAGSYQPISTLGSFNNEIDEFNSKMINTVYREFCEEILNTNHMNEINSYKLLSESNDYKFCERFYKVYYLGAGLEPYNTKMEVLALGIIDFDDIIEAQDEDIVQVFLDEHKIEILSNEQKDKKKNKTVLTDSDKKEMSKTIDSKVNLDLIARVLSKQKENANYSSYEGDIKVEKLSKAMFEQFYNDNRTTPSSKEIFGFLYKNYDVIFGSNNNKK